MFFYFLHAPNYDRIQAMKPIQGLKKWFTTSKIILALVLVYLFLVIFPVKGLLWPGHWWGKTLIVFMNDNEARPCGGFVTAFGVLDLPQFKLELKNVYHFAKVDYGASSAPLDIVSPRRKFWDLGTTYDLEVCSQNFSAAYWQAEGKRPDQTILVQSSFLERWIDVLGWLPLDGERINADNFFVTVSRNVSDVDRHDEASLENRKQPLVSLGKSLVKKTVLNPLNWPSFTRLFKSGIDNHLIYWSGYSDFQLEPVYDRLVPEHSNVISVSEWNLGGGKSSRYLRKSWSVDFREIRPKEWRAKVKILIDHIGGYSEPLSQDWQGGFELNFLGKNQFIPASVSPGQSFVYETEFVVDDLVIRLHNPDTDEISKLGLFDIRLFTPTYQNWRTDFSVSVFPEQSLTSGKEGIGWFRGQLPPGGRNFSWAHAINPDTTPPFLVIHKPIGSEAFVIEQLEALNFAAGDLLVEFKFNEKVQVNDNFLVELKDRNVEIADITSNPAYKRHILLEDQQSLVVSFAQNPPQADERFDLLMSGVSDLWDNEVRLGPRTVITR